MSQRLVNLLEPVVSDLGYVLWHLQTLGGGKNTTLRLYIDSADGIDIEDCEAVSREVSAVLDVDDDGDSAYTLEVSSPGLDRPLITAAHFREFVGDQARVRMYAPVEGHRKFVGVIEAVTDAAVELRCKDQAYQLPLGDMAKASLEPVNEE